MAPVRSRPAGALEFFLPGSWAHIDVTQPLDKSRLRREVEKLTGSRDDLSKERARMVEMLESVLADPPASLESLLICAEIEPGTPLPILLAVHGTDALYMSPAIGTDPDAVLAVFKQGREQLYGESAEESAEVVTRTGKALRTSQVTDMRLHPSNDEVTVPALVATYWVTIPDSKHLMAATFYTPMVDIAHLAMRYFDAIVGASRYVGASEA